MPAPLLGLLLLACPHHCELPLPHGALELRAAGSHWQWCLRAETHAAWRLCDEDLAEWWRSQLADGTRPLRVQALPGKR